MFQKCKKAAQRGVEVIGDLLSDGTVRVASVGAGLAVPVLANAATTYDDITAAVSWGAVGAAIVAIAALKAAPLVISAGSKMVLRMIGR